MSTLIEIGQGINMLKVAFPNYQPDIKATADLWTVVLGDLPGETLKAAIMQCLTEHGRQFAPSIGEIRGTALRLNAKAAGVPDAWQAFEETRKMPAHMMQRELIQENGENIILERPLKFSHPLVESVARMLGWPETFPTDMPAADRSQFIKAYESEMSRALDDAGRLKIVSDYIDKRRMMGADALALVGNITKQLETKHASN